MNTPQVYNRTDNTSQSEEDESVYSAALGVAESYDANSASLMSDMEALTILMSGHPDGSAAAFTDPRLAKYSSNGTTITMADFTTARFGIEKALESLKAMGKIASDTLEKMLAFIREMIKAILGLG